MVRSAAWRAASSSSARSSRSRGSTRVSRGENFSVVSMLAPRAAQAALAGDLRVRPARRQPRRRGRAATARALLDELERELDAATAERRGRRSCGGCRRRSRRARLPREPFGRLIEANRIDQRTSALRDAGTTSGGTARTRPSPWGGSCSASTGGRASRTWSRCRTTSARASSSSTSSRIRRATSRSAASTYRRRICGGSASPSRARGPVRGSARDAVPIREPPGQRRCSERGFPLAERSAAASGSRSRCSPAAGSPRSPRSSARAGTSSRGGRRPSRLTFAWLTRATSSSGDEARGRLRGVRADHAPRGAELRLGDHAAAATEAARAGGALRVRAPRRRHRRRRRGAPSCAARSSRRWARLSASCRARGDDPVLLALADTRRPLSGTRRARSRRSSRARSGTSTEPATRTWAELREYCRRVAGAVGIACTAVYGPRDPERA